jgi:hypothetical protein
VGAVVGFAVGRATSSGVGDAVATARAQASTAAIGLQRLPNEYQKALTGTGGESAHTVTLAIDRARGDLDRAWAEAPWFSPATRAPVDATVAALGRTVAAGAPLTQFQAAVDAAVKAIATTFGVTVGADH